MRFVLAMLILVSLSAAACAGEISKLAPAVIGDGGGLVNISVSMEPGTGDIYSSIYPRIGIDTQDSIDDAVDYAFFILEEERKDCDVFLTIKTPAQGYVDGPSAGAMISVLAYAVLENETVRDDTILTGGVDANGRLIAVGGLYEKAKAAAGGGAAYFLTPLSSFHDVFILRNVEKEYGIQVLYAADMVEMIDFLVYNKTIEPFNISSTLQELPEIEEYPGKEPPGFYEIAQRMIEIEEYSLASLPSDDADMQSVREYFENEIEIGKYLTDKKYYFTAANYAFLNYIEIETLKKIQTGDVDLSEKKQEITSCLDETERPLLTTSNFEWIVGSDLRRTWALYRMSQIDEEEYQLMDEKYFAYNQLMFSDAWCHVSKVLQWQGAIISSGEMIDESGWEPLAVDYIAFADSIPDLDSDLQERVDMAKMSYDEGRYGAAIYDSAYVTAFLVADSDIRDFEGNELEEEVDYLLETDESEALWSKVYRGQAVFLAKDGDYENAYRLLLLSRALDEATLEMRSAIPEKVPVEEPPAEIFSIIFYAALLLIFIIFLVLFSYTILRWRCYGDKGRRPYRHHGVKEQKGKARVKKGVSKAGRGS